MKERYYINKVDVLGVNVSAMKADKAVNATWGLMKRQGLAKVFFLTAEGSLYCTENPEVAEKINECNLILASDAHMEKALITDQQTVPEDFRPGSFAAKYIEKLFDKLDREHADVFVVAETEEQLAAITEYIGNGWEHLRIKGASVPTENADLFENAVNNINGIIPECVLICLPFISQYEFLKRYSSMINARLCVYIEKLQPIAEREIVEVPGFFKTFGLGNLFHWFRNKRRFSERAIGSAFNRKVNEENQSDNDISM